MKTWKLRPFRPLLGLALATVFSLPLGAQVSYALRLDPVVVVPVGNASGVVKDGQDLDLYSPGLGVEVSADASFLGFLSPYLRLGLSSVPLNGVTGSSLLTQQASAGVSVSAYPLPRAITTFGVGAGLAYTAFTTSESGIVVGGLAPYWSVRTELGYRFTPGFSLSALAGYSETLGTRSAIFKGLTAGLRFNLGLDSLGGGATGVAAEVVREERVFPIAYDKSEKVPLATVRLVNNDAAEIRDVRVTFSAGAYTSREALCAQYDRLLHGESVEVPILASFNDKVLGFTETTKISGEVRIAYKILDAQRTESKAITVVFHNRNSIVWSDPQVVGAFVSPQDPVMLELSKYLAGLVRVRAVPEIDKGLQYGMGIFEGLRLYGLVWGSDPSLPYPQARSRPDKLAYLQYPAQTLSYKSGDSDSLALTIAEALVSIAVPAAVAPLPEEALVAFALEMTEAQAKATFSNPKNFIFEDGKAWVPLRPSLIRDGFLRAWQGGAEMWQAQPADRPPTLVRIDAAWKAFPAVALPALEFVPVKPNEEAVNQAFDRVISRFAQAEVEPKVQRILSGVKGDPTGSQRNSLGVVYAQYGIYDKAKAEFEKAAQLAYAPSIINLANISFLRKEYAEAAVGFESALLGNPKNKNVLLSLARVRYELGQYEQADELLSRVREIDPALAGRFAYLSLRVGGEGALP